jgi:hypothetical protein
VNVSVTERSGILLVVLLALCVFAPAAGALYIEGQTIPDDGLMHIMSAGDDAGATAPAGMPVDENLPVSIPNALPAGLWDDSYAGETGMPDALQSMIAASTMPVMLPYDGAVTMPLMTVPSSIVTADDDNVVGNSVSPATQDYWGFSDLGSLQMNMPMVSDLFF